MRLRHFDIVASFSPRYYESGAWQPFVITDYKSPICGIALHGRLPRSAIAIAVPYEHRERLVEYLATITTTWAATLPAGEFPTECIMLRPGHAVPFGCELRQGVSVWVGCIPYDFTTESSTGTWGDAPSPLLRIYTEAPIVSDIGFDDIPMRFGCSLHPAAAPAGTSHFDQPDATAIPIGQDADTVRIVVESAGSSVVEVWWLDASGVWIHNDDDDFDTAGHGAATATHNCQTFATDGSVLGVYLRHISGDDFTWCAVVNGRCRDD